MIVSWKRNKKILTSVHMHPDVPMMIEDEIIVTDQHSNIPSICKWIQDQLFISLEERLLETSDSFWLFNFGVLSKHLGLEKIPQKLIKLTEIIKNEKISFEITKKINLPYVDYVKYYIIFNLFTSTSPGEDPIASIVVNRWLDLLTEKSGVKILFDDNYYNYKTYIIDKYLS